jgi:hypothetical protein
MMVKQYYIECMKSKLLKILNEVIEEQKVDGKHPDGLVPRIADGSGVKRQTVRKVFDGTVRDPRASTTEALLVYFKRMPKFKDRK